MRTGMQPAMEQRRQRVPGTLLLLATIAILGSTCSSADLARLTCGYSLSRRGADSAP
jgi:hypothetical protein